MNIPETPMCPICHDELKTDVCLVDCGAQHAFHFACLSEHIRRYKRTCPLDRQNIMNRVYNGTIALLPEPPAEETVINEIQLGTEMEDSPCYVCHETTRQGLDFDEVVICSQCEVVYCHAECQERVTGRVFEYSYFWYCPACRLDRRVMRGLRTGLRSNSNRLNNILE